MTATAVERDVACAPGVWRAALAILRKDVSLELRTRQTVPAMALFSLTVFVLFHFGLERNTVAGSLASGILWVTLLLATVLAVTRLFTAEKQDGAMGSVLLAPVDRTAVYVAKALSLLLYLVLLEVVALPALWLLLGAPVAGAFPALLAILALADAGLAAVGALVAGLASEARARELVVPLALLPLLVPVLIAAADATRPLLAAHAHAASLAKWLGFLALYDVVFMLVALAVFDYLLDD